METRQFRVPVVVPLDADVALGELTAAIDLVASGSATRVTVTCVSAVEAVAGEALVHAQAAHVAFTLSRDDATGVVSAIVGPRAV